MKSYHKLYYYDESVIDKDCWAFDKLDGQNMRFEGNLKRGFYKFGSRTQMVPKNDEQFGIGVNIFLNKYHDQLIKILSDQIRDKSTKITAFAELVGENSFCGKHNPNDELDLILFDIWIYKKGWVTPQKFIDDYGHLGIPNLIYRGKLTDHFISDVQEDKFLLKEGVIAKGNDFMVKVKTKKWLTEVRNKLGEKYLMEDVDYKKELIII